jgi:hypothetical protein
VRDPPDEGDGLGQAPSLDLSFQSRPLLPVSDDRQPEGGVGLAGKRLHDRDQAVHSLVFPEVPDVEEFVRLGEVTLVGNEEALVEDVGNDGDSVAGEVEIGVYLPNVGGQGVIGVDVPPFRGYLANNSEVS